MGFEKFGRKSFTSVTKTAKFVDIPGNGQDRRYSVQKVRYQILSAKGRLLRMLLERYGLVRNAGERKTGDLYHCYLCAGWF